MSGVDTGEPIPFVREARAFERLVCVCPNPSIDKIASVPVLRPGAIHRPELLTVLPGGKALNVARAAATLGLDVTAAAILAGRAGEWIADALRARGIPTVRVRVEGETRSCLSVLDGSTGELTEFYEPGVSIRGGDWSRFEEALAAEVDRSAPRPLVIVSGSLPRGAPEDGYRRLVDLVAGRGALAAIDVGGARLASALPSRPWLVKVNAVEAGEALGIPTADEAGAVRAVSALRDRGASIAVVTRGVRGAVIASAAGTWRLGPPAERGLFPVGSGDAFLAGFSAALARGCELPEAARRGGAVAAGQALVPGQCEFRTEDVERLLPTIAIDWLE